MATGTLIYEGKAKKIFTTGHPDEVLQYFKDDATAFNAQKRGTIVEKGIINNKVSERLFRLARAERGAHALRGAEERSGNAHEKGHDRAG